MHIQFFEDKILVSVWVFENKYKKKIKEFKWHCPWELWTFNLLQVKRMYEAPYTT